MNDPKNREKDTNVDPRQHARHNQPEMEEGQHKDKRDEQKKDKPEHIPPVTTQDKLEKIRDIIESCDTPMVTTVHLGKPMSRPMKLQEAEFDGTLWFFTLKETAKFDEIKTEPGVNVAFVGSGFLSLSGTGEFVDDPALKKRLWNSWVGKFFDLEYDDQRVTLLKVNAESAEYWEKVGKVKNILNFVKSLGGEKKSEDEINSSLEFSKT